MLFAACFVSNLVNQGVVEFSNRLFAGGAEEKAARARISMSGDYVAVSHQRSTITARNECRRSRQRSEEAWFVCCRVQAPSWAFLLDLT
jgi:hypothetical protein